MFGRFLKNLEENLIAALLAAMVLVTFSQVIARYVFNSGAVWALVDAGDPAAFLEAWRRAYTAAFPELAGDSRFFVTAPAAGAGWQRGAGEGGETIP